MGMFSSLFGSSGSDKTDKLRQQAIDAFNAVKTPELSDLQVQLQKYVDAGTITPEQAESQLLTSNAFNDIVTDPSYVGAQKQALQQMQNIATQGGLTAIDKAQLNDITNQQNQQNQSQNQATIQGAQRRGMGNSDLTTVNQLINEQGSADRAANSGLGVAAQAQARALQAMQAAGTQGGALENQAYGEQANKANAENAIDLFNKQTLNQANLYNTQTSNAAQAANLANKQAVENANTSTQNANDEYNAQQVQQQYNDEMQKAAGKAGVLGTWANDASNQAKNETAADMSLTGGLLQGGATALGAAFGGPAGAAAASALTDSSSNVTPGSTNSAYKRNADGTYSFAEGGMVPDSDSQRSSDPMNVVALQNAQNVTPEDIRAYQRVLAALQSPSNNPQPSSTSPSDLATMQEEALQNAQRDPEHPDHMAMGGHVHCYSHGGEAYHHPECAMNAGGFLKDLKKGALHKELGVPQGEKIPTNKIEKATHSDDETLRKRAQFAANASHWDHAKDGGKVPGKAEVKGDSPKNDTVDAKLSPGEIVVPRSAANDEKEFEDFMAKFRPSAQAKKPGMAKGGLVPSAPRVNESNPMRDTVRAPEGNPVPLAATNDANDFSQMMGKFAPKKPEPPIHVPVEARALANLHHRVNNLEKGKI